MRKIKGAFFNKDILCLQPYGAGAHREADQNAPTRDYDAERPGERHLQGG